MTFAPSPAPSRPAVADIQLAVARHYRLSKAELLCRRRRHDLVRARQVAIYLARQMTMRSLPEIGKLFGGRDHTTVLHAARKIERALAGDADLAAAVAEIQADLEASAAPEIDPELLSDTEARLIATAAEKLAGKVAAMLAEQPRRAVVERPSPSLARALVALAEAVSLLDQEMYGAGEAGARALLEKRARALAALAGRMS